MIPVRHTANHGDGKQQLFHRLPLPCQRAVLTLAGKLGLPLSPPPAGYYVTLDDWLTQGSSKPSYKRTPSFPEETLLRTPPKGLESSLPQRFEVELQKKSPALSVTEIPQGRVWGIQGTVLSPDNAVLLELSRDFRPPPEYAVFQHPWLRAPHRVSGTAALIAAPAGMTYAHWYFDVLTRLAILEEAGFDWRQADHIIVNSLSQAFQRDTLCMLGIPTEKLLALDTLPHIQAEHLLVPSLPGHTGNFPHWTVPWLRQHLLPHAQTVPEAPRRLYISRRKATSRKIRNEDALLPILTQRGFHLLCNEDFSVAEQMGIFSNAEAVIGPMGSSMANLLFSQPQTKTVETYSRHDVNVYTWSFGQFIPLDFAYLLGEPVVEAHVHPHNYDYTITPQALSDTLDLMHL